MAIWQFDISLIPRETADTAELLDDEGLVDSGGWWDGRQPRPDLEECLDAILPRAKSWSEKIAFWGSDQGNSISVHRTGLMVDEIFVRLDLREPVGSFVSEVLALASSLGCKLCLMEGPRVIEPVKAELAAAIAASSAFRFVRDPMEFIRSLGGPD